MERVNRDVLKYSFGNRIIDQWNNIPDEVVNATSINRVSLNNTSASRGT